MIKRKRTRVTYEVHEVTVTRLLNSDGLFHGLCEECGSTSRISLPDLDSKITGLGSREIFRRIEAGTIHFRESSEGAGFICLESVLGEPPPLPSGIEDGESQSPGSLIEL